MQGPADLHTAAKFPRNHYATRTATHNSLYTTWILLLHHLSAVVMGTELTGHWKMVASHLKVFVTISTVIGQYGPMTCCSVQSVWCVWRTLWVRSSWWVCPVAMPFISSALSCGWQQEDTAAQCVAGQVTRRSSRELHRESLLKTHCRNNEYIWLGPSHLPSLLSLHWLTKLWDCVCYHHSFHAIGTGEVLRRSWCGQDWCSHESACFHSCWRQRVDIVADRWNYERPIMISV